MKTNEYDISAIIALAFFLGLYMIQFYLMYRAIINNWNYRIIMDYNYYNEFWIELIMMILSLPFIISFSRHTLLKIKNEKLILKER